MTAGVQREIRRAGGVKRPLRRRMYGIAALAAVAVVALAGCSSSGHSSSTGGGGSASADSGKVFKLRLSTDITPNNSLNTLILATLKNDVSKATDGRLQITTYDSGTLYSTQALALAAAERGQVDLVFTSIGQALSTFPVMDGPNLGFLAPTFTDYFKLVGPGEPWFTAASKEVAAKNLTLVPIIPSAPGQGGVAATSKTPITTMAGLSGLKMRVPGAGLLGDELQQLGVTAVALSPTETPPALSSGTIDAAFGSASFAGSSTKGLTKGFFDTGTFQLGPYYMYANSKTWSQIPASVQQEFVKVMNTALQGYLNKFETTQDIAYQALQADGNWVTHITTADETKYQQLFASTVWPKYGSEDKAGYAALIQGRKNLNLR